MLEAIGIVLIGAAIVAAATGSGTNKNERR